ncbi:MAG: pyridoxamine 5'-phosphate oxidase family protein [Lacisediminihabitans sp.]
MFSEEGAVDELDTTACWNLLKANELGRLAVTAAGEVDIFPITYYADGQTLLFRTAPGTKLLEIMVHNNIALEIDGYTDTDAWSVVVKGTARWLEHQDEITEADTTPLRPWVPTLKYAYVRITPTTLTGRHFNRVPEPER